MKPYNPKQDKNKPMSALNKKDKKWKLEFKWVDEKAFHTYSKTIMGNPTGKYSDKWQKGFWNSKFISPTAAKQHLEANLKSQYIKTYYLGRNWRVFNTATKEVIELI